MAHGTMKKVFHILIFVFLLGNLVIRLGSIFNYPPFNGVIAGFLGVGVKKVNREEVIP
ncbi:MAG: hypothetical protein ACQEQ7_09840 [Thermodesulfobacteriota bacterium]